jgi:hypothetical protein
MEAFGKKWSMPSGLWFFSQCDTPAAVHVLEVLSGDGFLGDFPMRRGNGVEAGGKLPNGTLSETISLGSQWRISGQETRTA